jgi:hypothetical protein
MTLRGSLKVKELVENQVEVEVNYWEVQTLVEVNFQEGLMLVVEVNFGMDQMLVVKVNF